MASFVDVKLISNLLFSKNIQYGGVVGEVKVCADVTTVASLALTFAGAERQAVRCVTCNACKCFNNECE